MISYFKNEKTKILFLSSDSVFNSEQIERSEYSKPMPSTIYGKQKYAVEQFLLNEFREHAIILRLTKVLSKISPICKPLLSKDKKEFLEFRYKKNYFFAPITIDYCLANIFKLLQHNKSGVYHFSNERIVSSFDLFFDLSVRLDIFSQNRLFFRDNDKNTNQITHRGYLNMVDTPKEIFVEPEKYNSLIDYLSNENLSVNL